VCKRWGCGKRKRKAHLGTGRKGIGRAKALGERITMSQSQELHRAKHEAKRKKLKRFGGTLFPRKKADCAGGQKPAKKKKEEEGDEKTEKSRKALVCMSLLWTTKGNALKPIKGSREKKLAKGGTLGIRGGGKPKKGT